MLTRLWGDFMYLSPMQMGVTPSPMCARADGPDPLHAIIAPLWNPTQTLYAFGSGSDCYTTQHNTTQ